MIVVDSSVFCAVLLEEEDHNQLMEKLASVSFGLVSAANHLETSIRLRSRLGPKGVRSFDRIIQRLNMRIVSVDGVQALIAREAYFHYGKGFHPAALNFGDCFAYALARVSGYPLLFKGNDFIQTDIEAA